MLDQIQVFVVMKYVVISDVHANWPSLKSVYDSNPDADEYIFLGDMVGLGGFPDEVVESIKSNCKHAIKGNHDVKVIEHGDGHVNSQELSKFEFETTQDALDDGQKEWLSNLDSYKTLDNPSSVVAHAEPYPELSSGIESSGVKKRDYTKVASDINSDKYDYVLTGHTHVQSKLDCSDFGHNITIVNPGSVGQPIKSGVANYAVINTDKEEVSLEQSSYDSEDVFSRLESLNVPIKWWVERGRRRRS